MITASFMRSEPTMARYGLKSGDPKFELYLKIFEEDLFQKGIMYKILKCKTFEAAFNEIKNVVGIADFLAYQLIQDLNYSTLFNFDPNSFCAAGPGTIRGIERTFDITGKPDYQEIVKWTHDNYYTLVIEYSDKFGVDLKANLIPNLPLTVPDFSNCFCETSKYLKGCTPGTEDGDKRIKQLYKPSSHSIKYQFPPKFGNIKI
jgi:hypothetical protein